MTVDSNPNDPDRHLDFETWFARLEALTSRALDEDDWFGRWFDCYTPEEALEDGPEDDDDA